MFLVFEAVKALSAKVHRVVVLCPVAHEGIEILDKKVVRRVLILDVKEVDSSSCRRAMFQWNNCTSLGTPLEDWYW